MPRHRSLRNHLVKKIAIFEETIALARRIYCTVFHVLIIHLITRNDQIQQAQERKEKGLSEGKAQSRKSETKKYQRHRYQLCSKVYEPSGCMIRKLPY
jgi:hypothetical protein